jgi:hypothetical protein
MVPIEQLHISSLSPPAPDLRNDGFGLVLLLKNKELYYQSKRGSIGGAKAKKSLRK